MKIRLLRALTAGAFTTLLLAACAADTTDHETRAARIHDEVLVLDSEIDVRFDLYANPSRDPAFENDAMQFDIPKMERGGLDAAVFVLYGPQGARTPEAYEEAYAISRTKLAAIERMAAENPKRMEIAKTADDVERIVAAGKRAALIGMVNANALGPNLEELDFYDDAGLIYIAFTHTGHNHLSDSARPVLPNGDGPTEHGGLSALGKELVREMNRRGILVDVSQISAQALRQAAEISQAPIIASHSAIHALVPTARNITDDDLLAIKKTGGVIQVVAFRSFILDTYDDLQAGIEKVRQRYGIGPTDQVRDVVPPDQFGTFLKDYGSVVLSLPMPTVAQYVDHIDYAVNLMGIDHVGISTDFEHGGGIDGWNDVSETGNVTLELVRRGYSKADIAKIMGGNFLRVMREAETVAARLTNRLAN